MIFTFAYLFAVVLMSFITMIIYGADKRRAVKEKRRIPEKALFGMSFFGGALGSLFGMTLFSHKTKHIYFWILNSLFLLLQIIVLVLLIYLEIKVL